MSKSSRRDSEQDERSGQGKGTDAKVSLGKAGKKPARQNGKTTDRTKKQRKRERQRFDPAKTFVAWARGIGERYAERARVRKRRREERKSMPRKRPMFARLFNWVLPGDYSPQDDRRHVVIVSVVIIALVGLLAGSAFKWSSYISYQTSDMILIPSTSFIETQTDSVTEELEKQGFKNIEKDESGNIIGHGTPEMVDAYKESYKEKSFDPARDELATAQLQDSVPYYRTDMTQATAIVMGTEATGLSGIWRESADRHIMIPMLGKLDSLNVSVSAAILLYEAVRQRNG